MNDLGRRIVATARKRLGDDYDGVLYQNRPLPRVVDDDDSEPDINEGS